MSHGPQADIALFETARVAARASGRSISSELEVIGNLLPHAALEQVGALFGMPALALHELNAQTPAFDLLPLARAMQRCAVLFRNQAGSICAAITDPQDIDQQTWLEAQADRPITFRLALEADIEAYLARQEESVRAIDTLSASVSDSPGSSRTTEILSYASVNDTASPVVKVVNSTLYDALRVGASDIHLESTATGLAVKYRVDGVLDHAASLSGAELAEQVISRLKVLAELDIAERRVPQDGSFRVESRGREIDLRVSIMPSIHGEDAVIRILDKRAMIEAHGALTLEALGFDGKSLVALRRLAAEPYGMLLVTGPTGSGKTTTLYAAISEIHNGRDKIITIEDPVEYQLPGVLQIPVNDKKGLTFAKGLRSILRHDPDKIMVGEIRDRETAEIAVQSALTGHLVLTTVHANNVFDVFGRFTHMGVDPYAFVSALNGIWAQRLVRLICPRCAEHVHPSEELVQGLGLSSAELADFNLRAGRGCGDCRSTGYLGRKSIAEILILNDELRELVVAKAPIRHIKEAARKTGTRSLREAALDLARMGETTLEEVKRVTLQA
ncbi:GspE/PulE family protein [Ralstonia sp. CHL-2022]|uniref:GspE/PulE family protein n=1 Tax=Ralstonia mojiangensis TaxID=2953895 RepID=A0ABT2LD23_9RALS|nr:GspE/PulE family protein [Ralstonia mojiangensis]MCT7313300.1 GspE/PulE family protein [Ralstonia mojiangensis]